MSPITKDKTLEKERKKRMLEFIKIYEEILEKKHPKFHFVTEFYRYFGLKRQNFIKYYNRFKQEKDENTLLPQRRGPKFKIKYKYYEFEEKIIELRKLGSSKYEIYRILLDEVKDKMKIPSKSQIYNIFVRYGVNVLNKKMKEEHKKIIKMKAGELGHIDCHYLPKGLIKNDDTRYFLVGLIDDYSRITHVEMVNDIRSLTVMFATLKMLNIMQIHYDIKFKEMLTDNGNEFGGGPMHKNKDTNPFKKLMSEMGIKQRFTKPYRPQTNGKIERFWKTLNEELIEDVVFDSIDLFKEDLIQFLYYYNNMRPHQGINGNTPFDFLKNPSSN